MTIGEVKSHTNRIIRNKWTKEYEESNKGKFYKSLHPKPTPGINYKNKNRHKEVKLTRLMFHKCATNAYRAQMNPANSPNCTQCGIPETLEHIILDCQKHTAGRAQLLHNLAGHNKQDILRSLLSNTENQDKLYKYLCENGITV
jgi:hypothetical protein